MTCILRWDMASISGRFSIMEAECTLPGKMLLKNSKSAASLLSSGGMF